MPTTENTRRNLQQVDLQNPSVPKTSRLSQEGMHQAGPTAHVASDLIEDSELPAVEASMGAGIQSRNSEENGELNESLQSDGFLTNQDQTLEDISVNSQDQDNKE